MSTATRTRPPADPGNAPPRTRAGVVGPRATAATIVAVGVLATWQSLRIPAGGGYTAVGPQVLPLVVSAALIVFGVALLVTVTVRPDAALLAKGAAERAATHWPTPIALAVALVAYAAALTPAGYVVATSVFLPVAARVLGSRSLPRDAVVGLVVSIVLYVGFTGFLGVRLPAGLLAGVPGLG